MHPTRHAPATPVRALAVFDLDGTITRADTLVVYLRYALQQYPRRAWSLWKVPALLLGYLRHRDRGVLKSQLLTALLHGLSRTEMEQLSRRFLDKHLDRLTRAGALRVLQTHRAKGDYLVLLSASVDLYVPLIGERLGFHESICTEIAWHHNQLSGGLTTANRHGAEKTRVIRALKEKYPHATVSAYGNARSDLAHLLTVDYPTVVNARWRTAARARALGLPVEQWSFK